MNTIGIIPARWASTRLPGKPLKMIAGKPMIQHVYERAVKALGEEAVWVATDDERIRQAVIDFGGRALMTSPDLRSGTDRCWEAYKQIKHQYNNSIHCVINIQGDQPLIRPASIAHLLSLMVQNWLAGRNYYRVSTMACKVQNMNMNMNYVNPGTGDVFVVMDRARNALSFSRWPLPYIIDVNMSVTYFKHIGIYAFRPEALERFALSESTPLEMAEGLEQLRWLEMGYKMRVAVTKYDDPDVDTMEDLERVRAIFKKIEK